MADETNTGTEPSQAKLRCEKCGNVQNVGDWERFVDERAQAMGISVFGELETQCVKCGATNLKNLSAAN